MTSGAVNQITVLNNSPGGGTSNALPFTVPFPTVQIADGAVAEPGPGQTTNLVFTVTRTGDLASQLTVGYTTVAGTAQPGVDYTPETNTVTFAAGSPTATIGIPVFGNGFYNNPSLTFSVKLTGVTNVVGSSIVFGAGADFAAGSRPISVTVGDINGDGKPDIVVANKGTYTVSILLNTTAAGAGLRPHSRQPQTVVLPAIPHFKVARRPERRRQT